MFGAVERSKNWELLGSAADCSAALHAKPFVLRHALADNPLFSFDALAAVAEEWTRRPPLERGKLNVHMDGGDVAFADKAFSGPRPQKSPGELIRHIKNANALVLIQHLEAHPDYKPLLDEFKDFIRALGGPEAEDFLPNHNFIAFITSPRRKTAYHFDEEINFLMQARGAKTVFVCDPLNRETTPEECLEREYCGDIYSAVFKPEFEEAASKFVLSPGDAVHIPTHGAHWVETGEEPSVSISMYFKFPPSKYADVYKFNRYLRRLGLTPRPPGVSPLIDRAKGAAVATARNLKNLLRR